MRTFRQWLETVAAPIYVDNKGHLASPDQQILWDFVDRLYDAGASGIRPDGMGIAGGMPHFDLLVDGNAEQTKRNIEIAVSLGAVLLSSTALMRAMKTSGAWTDRPRAGEVSGKRDRYLKLQQQYGAGAGGNTTSS